MPGKGGHARGTDPVRRHRAPEVENQRRVQRLERADRGQPADDRPAKRESPFGGTVAHGFLTLSLLPAMRAKPTWQISGFGNATNYGANKLRFVSPVPAGARIHARSRLTGVEAKPLGTQLTQELHVHVVGKDKPAVIYEMLVLYHPPMNR
ncbi:MAG: hypothetical protein E6J75_02940 [Deltaproteobacteria bacterium]|nr:MAG: hypothetical protein E6J75_02940 [Deltaproteobacteria bacterium]